jgi:hypothetical protein
MRYATAGYILASYLQQCGEGKAFDRDHIEHTLRLAFAWKSAEFIQAALGLTTLTMEQWVAAVGNPEGGKLPRPLWNQLLKETESGEPPQLHALKWYAENQGSLDAARCP